jgi:uncharacterized SAM-binding protein YcdF (DUF218 family)
MACDRSATITTQNILSQISIRLYSGAQNKTMNWIRNIFTRLEFITTILLKVLGALLLIAVIISFTDIPYNIYHWLGTHNSGTKGDPDLIVLLGGSGMPSADGLMRTYYAARTANEFPSVNVVIALPNDTTKDENSPELLMGRELMIRGVDGSRILYEPEGINTHAQAINIRNMYHHVPLDSFCLRLVTSPDHMFRAVRTFRKAGFAIVGGFATFEQDIEERKLVKRPGRKSEHQVLQLRYNMWNYLKYEIIILRECCAITYYKLRGWI